MATKKPTAAFTDINIEKAKAIVGWRDANDGEDGFRYTNEHGIPGKFVLDKNKENRRLNLREVKKLAGKMLRQQFAGQVNSGSSTCNGEAWIVGKDGQVISCAHRCVAVIFAEMERQYLINCEETELIEEYGCEKAISIPALLVTGIDPPAADTNDLARKRSNKDIIFRRRVFSNGQDVPESVQERLSKELATAAQRTWSRINGWRVSGCPEFSPEECRSFLEEHPRLQDALEFVYHEDGEKGISKYVTLGVAASCLYLMAHSGSSRQKLADGALKMDRKPKGWNDAEKFWTFFAQQAWENNEPIKSLRSVLEDNRASEKKLGRDEIVTLIFRAYLSWVGEESKWKTVRGLKSKLFIKVEDREVLDLVRLGGFDVDRDVLIEQGIVEERETSTVKQIPGWKIGDTCWVNQEGEEIAPWYGEIRGFDKDGDVSVYSSDDDAEYLCKAEWLSTEEPAAVEAQG